MVLCKYVYLLFNLVNMLYKHLLYTLHCYWLEMLLISKLIKKNISFMFCTYLILRNSTLVYTNHKQCHSHWS